jgi:hypothetical protein
MANLTQDPDSVLMIQGQSIDGIAASDMNAGTPTFLNDSAQWDVAGANVDAEHSGVFGAGVVLNTVAAGQPVTVGFTGLFNLGAALQQGESYVFSHTLGAICPIGDLIAGDFVTYMGTSLDGINLQTPPSGIFASGAQHY